MSAYNRVKRPQKCSDISEVVKLQGNLISRSAKGLGKCLCYNGGSLYQGFLNIHSSVIELKNVARYAGVV